ncbi:Transposable element Tc3 transposase [Araneus ventricosus]|uniref:Transposable element Tc3 transposase n=1 Tax=Araneus ventricosus TaxID=182803 RepID=A0A4Y2ILR8_ARAVE|nr:Transposable element Tc3 transposase [Araneus ventricosus]
MTSRQERDVVRRLSRGGISLRQLAKEDNIPVTKSILSWIVKRTNNLRYKKRKQQPMLKAIYKQKRVDWAKYHQTWKDKWHRVILLHCVALRSIGLTMRKEEKIFSKRQQGGGSLMVWGGFGYGDKLNLAFPSGRIKATNYQEILETHLLPFAEIIGGPSWIFQQDNTPIQVSKSSWEWFLDNGVHVMEWPALSPDLNPQEDVWGILSRAEYANGRQCQSVAKLKPTIVEAWDNIDATVLQGLVNVMPHRVFQVTYKHGGYIGY